MSPLPRISGALQVPRIRRLFGALLLVVSVSVVWPPSAGAGAVPADRGPVSAMGEFYNTVDDVGAGVHTCFDNAQCSVLEVNQPGTVLRDFCYQYGRGLRENPFWDLVYNRNTGNAGWTNEEWLANESQSQRCEYAGGTYPTGGAAQEGAGIHTCRASTCPVLGFVNGHTVIALCRSQGELLGGTSWWDLVYNADTRVAGWTNESWLAADATISC